MDKLELAERVENATGPDLGIDRDIWFAVGSEERRTFIAVVSPGDSQIPCYTASLDAALALVPDGWSWVVDAVGRASCFAPNEPKPWPRSGGLAKSPALALCAAALRARAEGGK